MTESTRGRRCEYCDGPIPDNTRADAKYCSKNHRQAAHRFKNGVGVAPGVTDLSTVPPMRLAYADPPYPGKSKKYYGNHPDYAGEVDHEALLGQLAEYDGWALSTSAAALPDILRLCPPGVQVGPWVRGERPTRSLGPLNAWEPVIYFGGRHHAPPKSELVTMANHDASEPLPGPARRLDALVFTARPRLTDPNRVIGAKPAVFARWIFHDLLGALPHDTLIDLFPGSGAIGKAWNHYRLTNQSAPTLNQIANSPVIITTHQTLPTMGENTKGNPA